MPFCTNCGHEITEGVKFCSNCGEHVVKHQNDNTYERKQEYAGTVLKCPACGEDLPSMTAICPACGHEINSTKVTDSLKNLIERINDCDMRIANSPELPKKGWTSWSKWQRILWVILNICLCCLPLLIYFLKPLLNINKAPNLTTEEKQKAAIIDNFVFPNERGAILESMLYVKSKVLSLANGNINNNSAYWIRLWANKATQLYQSAEILFPGDKIVNNAYEEIAANVEKVNEKLLTRFIISIGVIVLIFLMMYFL